MKDSSQLISDAYMNGFRDGKDAQKLKDKDMLEALQGGEVDLNIQPLGWLDTLLRICSTTDAYKAIVDNAEGDSDAINMMLNELARFSAKAKAALSKALD